MTLKNTKDDIEKKKNEGIAFTQEIGKQIRDNVIQLSKALDFQTANFNDKVRSLQLLMDNSEKKIKRDI